jgi:GNAT superfamily N-acetyltransferase
MMTIKSLLLVWSLCSLAPPLGHSFSLTTILQSDRRLSSSSSSSSSFPASNPKSYLSKPPSIVSGTTTTTTRLGLFFADPSPSKKDQPPQPPQQQQQQPEPAAAATIPPKPSSSSSSSSSSFPSIELITSDEEDFLNMVGYFLVDAFWLNSEHHQLGTDISQKLSKDVKMSLVVEQASDLQDKYGPRLGSRLFQSSVIAALDQDTKATVGVVTLKATLLVENQLKGTTVVLEAEEAEVMVKNAVAQLGPKQRRLYKNAPIDTIVKELLVMPSASTKIKAIVVLSNLAVSPQARRRGIAKTLCQEALAMVADWGFTELHLLVEEANVAARNLYETQLGYRLVFRNDGATALRVDLETGSFVEVEADTLGLVKKVNES